MRNKINLLPSRNSLINTRGSNKFVSTFNSNSSDGVRVEKRSSDNWKGYILALIFTLLVGSLTFIVVDYFMF